jgi:micrococcal nuclease
VARRLLTKATVPSRRLPAWSQPSALTARRLVTRVIDGDTLELDGVERIRLVGIDCPELDEPLGPVVAAWLRQRIEGQLVRLSFDPATSLSGHRDVFGRTLAYVWLADGRLLNREVVHLGFGAVDWRYPCTWTGPLLDAAREARRERRGIWQPASRHRCVRRTRAVRGRLRLRVPAS